MRARLRGAGGRQKRPRRRAPRPRPLLLRASSTRCRRTAPARTTPPPPSWGEGKPQACKRLAHDSPTATHTHNSTHGVSETRRPEPAPARALSTRAALPDAPATRPRRTPAQRDPHTHCPPSAPAAPWACPAAFTLLPSGQHCDNTRNPFTRRGLAARALARASRPLPRRLRLRQDTAVAGSPPAHSPAPLGQAQTRKPTKVSTGSAPPRARPAPQTRAVRARGACKEGDTHVPFDPHTHTPSVLPARRETLTVHHNY